MSGLHRDAEAWSDIWFTAGPAPRAGGEGKGKAALWRPEDGTAQAQELDGAAEVAELLATVLARGRKHRVLCSKGSVAPVLESFW